jgi:hypothetical protein
MFWKDIFLMASFGFNFRINKPFVFCLFGNLGSTAINLTANGLFARVMRVLVLR